MIRPVTAVSSTALLLPGAGPAGGPTVGETQGSRPRLSGQALEENEAAVTLVGTAVASEGPTVASESRIAEVVAGIVDSLPVDLNGLDTALDHCLGRIDAMGDSLAEILASDGAWPWLAGAVVGSAAGAVAGFWGRKNRLEPFSPAIGDGMPSPWFPEPLTRV